MSRPHLYLALCLGIILPTTLLAENRELRAWSNTQGTVILAHMVSFDGQTVVLKLNNGPYKEIPLTSLSPGDQTYVKTLDERGLAGDIRKMPDITEIVPQVAVSTTGRVFETQNYRFETDRDATEDFIRQAARVFEGTIHAIKSLPFGIDPIPPEGQQRFHARFMDRNSFDQLLKELDREGGTPDSKVGGIYISQRREIVVPYSSIGALNFGTTVTIGQQTDHSTLIHEISHQLLHNWEQVIPTWFTEGFAEYIAAVPYKDGRFEFRNINQGITEQLRYQHSSSTTMQLPAGLNGEDARKWDGTKSDYKDAMLMFYYLVHRPGEIPGHSITGYLKVLDRSQKDSLGFISSYNQGVIEYQKAIHQYNQAIENYNTKLEENRAQLLQYEKQIIAFNQAIRSGVSLTQLKAPVKPTLVKPTPPTKPVKPKVLQENKPLDQPLDLLIDANEDGKKVILNGDTPEQLAQKMATFFKASSIPISIVTP